MSYCLRAADVSARYLIFFFFLAALHRHCQKPTATSQVASLGDSDPKISSNPTTAHFLAKKIEKNI